MSIRDWAMCPCARSARSVASNLANVKAIKLLRPDYRVEMPPSSNCSAQQRILPRPHHITHGALSHTPSCIPKSQPEFFGSQLYCCFHIQRPMVHPVPVSTSQSWAKLRASVLQACFLTTTYGV
ncbi:hypothetical protein FRC06_007834, partial [Ceratobasidium sp. 370]